ncbi:MAG: hypothetical protein RLY16_1024 [Bacteroidota bacterium]
MKKYGLLAALLFFFASCGPSIRITTDRDTQVSLYDFHTYNWQPLAQIEGRAKDPRWYNELNDQRIRQAVDNAMQQQGFVLKEGEADLQLHYHLLVELKSAYQSDPFGQIPAEQHQLPRAYAFQYREGSLIIDIMHVPTNRLVWRGTATDVITPSITDNIEAAIKLAVQKLFKKMAADIPH